MAQMGGRGSNTNNLSQGLAIWVEVCLMQLMGSDQAAPKYGTWAYGIF